MTYGSFSYFYDRLMQDAPYDKWVHFLHKKKAEHKINGNQVLDLACGTGELSIRFAKSDFDVTGIDISTDMLTVAQSKAADQGLSIPFYEQSMVELNGIGQFDIVTIFCDSLNYLKTEDDVLQTFKRIYDHLRPGGLLLFDVHSIYKIDHLFLNETFGLNDHDISYVWHSYAGEYEHSIEHELTFFVLDKQSGQYDRFDEFHEQRTFSVEKYVHLLQEARFDVKSIQGDFTEKDMNDTSERIFFTAQKR